MFAAALAPLLPICFWFLCRPMEKPLKVKGRDLVARARFGLAGQVVARKLQTVQIAKGSYGDGLGFEEFIC